MIVSYNKFNEGINQYLKGPTREDVINYINNSYLSDEEKLYKSIEIGYLDGITKAMGKLALNEIEHGLIQALRKEDYDVIEHIFKIGGKPISEKGWVIHALKTKNNNLLEILKRYISDDVFKEVLKK